MTDPAPPQIRPASVRPERRFSFAWLVPIAALIFAAWLIHASWRQRGIVIHVHFPDGHGLKVGDAVRFRGIVVGDVREIRLLPSLEGIDVSIGLREDGDRIARQGSRFWIVRPRLDLTGVSGVETLIGPRYVAVHPGRADADSQRQFVGMPDAPIVESVAPDDLQVILESPDRYGIRAGAEVTYRGVRVGTVLSVGLASDAAQTEIRVHIDRAYRALVREGSRFWSGGGVRAEVGLSGATFEVGTLEALLSGSIAFATPAPDDAGAPARTGHRFRLAANAEDDWLDWEPVVAIGSTLLPLDAPRPAPHRATLVWREGIIFKGRRSRSGWLLSTERGLIGPPDLLGSDDATGADDKAARTLDVAGVTLDTGASEIIWATADLTSRATRIDPTWPAERMRQATVPEDCLAFGDPAMTPLPLSTARMTAGDAAWELDAALVVDAAWHGAAVLSRSDGRLVGILIAGEDRARVALLPAEALTPD